MEQDPYLLWGKQLWGDSPSPVAPGILYSESQPRYWDNAFSIEEVRKLDLGLTLLLEAQS